MAEPKYERCPVCEGKLNCPYCKGTGFMKSSAGTEAKCPVCNGSGMCPACNGNGKIIVNG